MSNAKMILLMQNHFNPRRKAGNKPEEPSDRVGQRGCPRPDRELKPSDMLTRKEVCDLLRISLSTLHRAVRLGVLPAKKFGRRTLFKVSDIERVLTIQYNKQ